MKTLNKNLFFLPAIIVSLGLMPVGRVMAQPFTFGPEFQNNTNCSITYNSATGTFQYSDANSSHEDAAYLPLTGTAAHFITASNGWTASLTASLSARSMTATSTESARDALSLAVLCKNGPIGCAIFIGLIQQNNTGGGENSYDPDSFLPNGFYGTGVGITVQTNYYNDVTTPLGDSESLNGVSWLQLSGATGPPNSPATESISAASGVLKLSYSASTKTFTGYYNGNPVGSYSIASWRSNPALTLVVVGTSSDGSEIPAGTDTASNFYAGPLPVTQTGSLQVTITPAAAITAGAKWQVDGGKLQNSGATVANLAAGNHTVSFTTINGWRTPTNQIVSVNSNATATTSGTYVAIGSLQVTIGPAAAIAGGARWQVDYGTWQNSGTTVTNLAAGNHTVSYKGIDYWGTPANQTVSITAKSVAKVTGSYTFNGTGIYNGLFMRSDVTEETAGMLSGLDVTASASFTGKLLIGGSTNAISGGFNGFGQATNYLQRTAKQGGTLTLEMQVNWNNSPFTIGGTVSGTNGGAWTADLTAELAASGSSSAEYTALVLSGGNPPGSGYLLITNHAGAVTLSGALADGTPFSQAVPLSGAGDLPVYGNLYSSTGLLLGWLELETGSPAGNLTWIKKASRSTALYTNGFTNVLAVQGSPWTNPLPHTAAIDLPSGQLEIFGGGLPAPLSFNVAVSSNNALVTLSGSPTNSLTGSIAPKTGLLTITFGNGAGKATTAGTGAVLQNATSAGGFFLGKSNPGVILLKP